MDEHDAARRVDEGNAMLEALGDIPVAYGFACELPAAHGVPLHELDRLWYDHFDATDRDWMVVLNGDDEVREVVPLELLLEAGAAFVLCDNTLLGKVTPVGVTWFYDPDTGDPLEDESDIHYWDDQVIEVLHGRLTEKGKDLPPLSDIVSEKS